MLDDLTQLKDGVREGGGSLSAAGVHFNSSVFRSLHEPSALPSSSKASWARKFSPRNTSHHVCIFNPPRCKRTQSNELMGVRHLQAFACVGGEKVCKVKFPPLP